MSPPLSRRKMKGPALKYVWYNINSCCSFRFISSHNPTWSFYKLWIIRELLPLFKQKFPNKGISTHIDPSMQKHQLNYVFVLSFAFYGGLIFLAVKHVPNRPIICSCKNNRYMGRCAFLIHILTRYFPVRVMSQPCVPIKQNYYD